MPETETTDAVITEVGWRLRKVVTEEDYNAGMFWAQRNGYPVFQWLEFTPTGESFTLVRVTAPGNGHTVGVYEISAPTG